MNTYMSLCDGGMGTSCHSTFVEGGGQPWLSVLNLGADRVSLLFAISCVRSRDANFLGLPALSPSPILP